MKKILKYKILIVALTLVFTACEEHERTFDAPYVTDKALVRLYNLLPNPPNVDGGANYTYRKVEVNGVDVAANNLEPLNTWSAISQSLGRYYATTPGAANIKLYLGPVENPVLSYDQNVQVAEGKQGLLLYAFDKPPAVIPEPDNWLPYRDKFDDTDTIMYIRFFNYMYEEAGVESPLVLQYEYQYTINPLWTLADEAAGIIPPNAPIGGPRQSPVGQPRPNPTRSQWIPLGPPVAFGENTGWQIIPVKKDLDLSAGQARVDYRIRVVSGGTVDVNMNAAGVLLCRATRAATGNLVAYTDWWTATIGRRQYHLFGGYRDGGAPGVGVYTWLHK